LTVDVSSAVTIDKPQSAVWAFASNPDRAPAWYANIKEVEWKTSPPLSIGSRVAFVAQFLGRRLAYEYEIVELVENRRLVMRTTDGPFPMETIYTFEPAAKGRTRMTLRNRGNPSGFSAVMTPFLSWAIRRANRKDLARLRQRLESA
jgi:uncharacterized membrane protein